MSDNGREELVKKAIEIVEHSHLPKSDKELLRGRMPFIADIMLKMFVEVCEEDPFGVEAIVKNLKKKLDAQGNLKKLHEIVRQEREEAEGLLVA